MKDRKLALIVCPQGSPGNPKKDSAEVETNDYFCNLYQEAFGIPVIYVNSYGKLEYMPGLMGSMMKWSGFSVNGKTKIYANHGKRIELDLEGSEGWDIRLSEEVGTKEILFYGKDIIKGNLLFRNLILKPDVWMGVRKYKKDK